MNGDILPLLTLSAGALLVWAAVTDRSPLDTLQGVFQGKGVPAPRTGGTETVAGQKVRGDYVTGGQSGSTRRTVNITR